MFLPVDSYASDRVADTTIGGGAVSIALLVTHFSMLFASIYALLRHFVRLGSYGLAATIVSCMYHACRSDIYCFGLPLDELHKADHTTASTFFGAVVLHLMAFEIADRRGQYAGQVAGYALPIVAMLAVRAFPFQLQSFVLVLAFLAVVGAYRFLYGGHGLSPVPLFYYRPRLLVAGTVVAAISLVCYFFEDGALRNDTLLDGLVHAAWHLLSGVAIWLLVASVRPVMAVTSVR